MNSLFVIVVSQGEPRSGLQLEVALERDRVGYSLSLENLNPLLRKKLIIHRGTVSLMNTFIYGTNYENLLFI